MTQLSSRTVARLLHAILSLICLHGILDPHGLVYAADEECGSQAGGVTCPLNVCCSQWGFCGTAPVRKHRPGTVCDPF